MVEQPTNGADNSLKAAGDDHANLNQSSEILDPGLGEIGSSNATDHCNNVAFQCAEVSRIVNCFFTSPDHSCKESVFPVSLPLSNEDFPVAQADEWNAQVDFDSGLGDFGYNHPQPAEVRIIDYCLFHLARNSSFLSRSLLTMMTSQ